MNPNYLAIGHITRDLTPTGWTLGGAVTYAAHQAIALGRKVAIVTSGRREEASWLPCDTELVLAPETTTFRNVEQPWGRDQYVDAFAGPISEANVPDAWRAAAIVHLCPLVYEMESAIGAAFPNAFVIASAQGWLRYFDEDDHDHVIGMPPASPVVADAIVYSDEDIRVLVSDDGTYLDAPIVVLTRGADGYRLVLDSVATDYPAIPARVVDTTGAGDVFAAAFAIRYDETQNAIHAARFAAAAASLAVEAVGTAGIGDRGRILARLAEAA